jgi:hypothetical protein
MKHLRTDWQGIQDTTGETSIGDDEPVFIVRAKDPCAPATVRAWAAQAHAAGSDLNLCVRVLQWADEMEAYAREHFAGQQHAPDAPELLP